MLYLPFTDTVNIINDIHDKVNAEYITKNQGIFMYIAVNPLYSAFFCDY